MTAGASEPASPAALFDGKSLIQQHQHDEDAIQARIESDPYVVGRRWCSRDLFVSSMLPGSPLNSTEQSLQRARIPITPR